MFGHVLTQHCGEIQTGRTLRTAPPLGQGGVGSSALCAIGLESSEHQCAISRNYQGRLFGHADRIPKLSLTDAEGVLFFAMIYFDLPAIKVDLKQSAR